VDGLAGFPLILPRACLAVVERQVKSERLSLQALAQVLEARPFEPPARLAWRLFNVNTPEDFARARELYAQKMQAGKSLGTCIP
jgi:molybdopterin-guanine dinucleotide biosynthesis protein A